MIDNYDSTSDKFISQEEIINELYTEIYKSNGPYDVLIRGLVTELEKMNNDGCKRLKRKLENWNPSRANRK